MAKKQKERPYRYWNHRVITWESKSPFGTERLFSIVECHYENGVPVACSEYKERGHNILGYHVSLKDIKWTVNMVKKCLDKPILDGDNFPNEWEEKI